MKSLPIHHVLPEVKTALQTQNRVILEAPPGAGKTTALPLALLDTPWLEGKKIIMLEPRRLAVRASAARMAHMLGEKVGERIGYQVRLESVQSNKTRILIVTEGILTRKLQNDPALEDVGLIIFDEFHERSLHADLALALSLESQTLLREELKILIMSATLNTDRLAMMLDAPVIKSEGRCYPVTRHYLESRQTQPTRRELPAYIAAFVENVMLEEKGNILVFLPGVKEIKHLENILRKSHHSNLCISTLYGTLDKKRQTEAIEPPPKGMRKIVLATNIAQTSLTIEGISIVIDSGLQNISQFNPFSGMDSLKTIFISEDAATQRAGRAGRLQAGKAFHLWHRTRILAKHDTPEILQADLTQLVLELALWGTDDIDTMTWMDTPPAQAIAHAKRLLVQLGAIDTSGKITPHGQKMSSFGLHPRLSHMMIQAQEAGLSYEASLLASVLTEKDIFPASYQRTDIAERISFLHRVANGGSPKNNDISIGQCRHLIASARRLEPTSPKSLDITNAGLLLAYAYPERIAMQRRKNSTAYLLSNGKEAKIPPNDPLAQSQFLAVGNLNAISTNTYIHTAAPLTQEQIETHLKSSIITTKKLHWNETQLRVEARQIRSIGSIILSEKPLSLTHDPMVMEILLEAVKNLGLDVLSWSKEARQLQQRINFLHFHGEAVPDLSDQWLLAHMQTWLAPYAEGMTSIRELQGINLYTVLLGQLDYGQTQLLEKLAPPKYRVASGSQITIDYSNPRQPLLAVRLQEMFGTTDTPALLNGKVTMMLHLLSPAHRPIQVTQDLRSFWEHTYSEVKKELRGKYKKHYWPDDPFTATATGKTKKRM